MLWSEQECFLLSLVCLSFLALPTAPGSPYLVVSMETASTCSSEVWLTKWLELATPHYTKHLLFGELVLILIT